DSVTSIDYWAFYGCTSLEEISLPDTLTYIGSYAFTDTAYYNGSHWSGGTTLYIGNYLIECYSYNGYCEIKEGVICIADDAFQECENVTGIYIPNTVTSIGEDAFSGCTSLEYIDIPDSVVNMSLGAFDYCESLIEITIPAGVKGLGYEGSIDEYVGVYGCKSLEAIYVDSNNPNYTSVDGVLFNKNKTTLYFYPEGKSDTSYVVPTGTEKIVSVENNTYLKEVTISETVKEIASRAFNGCTRLGKITNLATNLEYVGSNPFYDTAYSYNPSNYQNHCMYIGDWAVAIEEDYEGDITIKEGTKYLAESLFAYTETIENVKIPASVINVNKGFGGYDDINAVNVAEGNPYFSTVDGVLFDKLKKELLFCPGGKKANVYTVPDGVEVIGDSAFYYCPSIGKIILPTTLKTIGDHSFYRGAFSEIEIPMGVTRIERGAFFWCENLTKITLPNTLQYIGVAIFDECENLETIVFKGTEEEFNNIEIDETNNEKLESVEIVFEPSVHTHSYTSTITKTPTCTETGVKTFTCTTCGYSYTQTISVTGHSYNSGVVTKQPTCTEAGTKTFTCTTCGDSYTESITATGHKWNSGSVTVQPTCTTVGEKTYVCNVCYESKSETISVLGHNYAKDFTIDKNP
ncbi:MAG: leucine-rich repeat domain-containing protein, partial [Clostridia bacterium]|nr:leucine-rich repeat domain-containing protein [Clostridia bacterium]